MTIRNRIAAADQRLLSRVTAADPPALDRATTGLGRAADHGLLWIAVAAGLGARRNKWTRRAALRGLAGMAIASAAANVLAKRLVRRTRPPLSGLILARPPPGWQAAAHHVLPVRSCRVRRRVRDRRRARGACPRRARRRPGGRRRRVARDLPGALSVGRAGRLRARHRRRAADAALVAAPPGRARRRGAAAPRARLRRPTGPAWSSSSTAARAPRPPSSPTRSAPGCRRPRSSWPTRTTTWRACSARRRREPASSASRAATASIRLAAGIAADAGLPLLVVPAGHLQSLRRRPRRRIRR